MAPDRLPAVPILTRHAAELPPSANNDEIEVVAPAYDVTLEALAPEDEKKDANVDADLEAGRRKRSASSVSAVGEWVGLMGGRIRGWTRSAPDSGQSTPTLPKGARLGTVGPWDERFNTVLLRVRAKRPRIGAGLVWLRGPSPPWIETELAPLGLPFVGAWLHRTERWCTDKLAPMRKWREFTTPAFLLVWLLGFIFLVRASFFTTEHFSEGTPNWIGATDSWWYEDTGCGVNATGCTTTPGYTYVFRCPSQALNVELLNPYAIGAESILYDPLVVGGFDSEKTYRGDSWICASAIQHGLFSENRGGCGQLELVGDFTGFVGGEANGVKSQSFDTEFPSAYRFLPPTSQTGCRDMRNDILGYNVAMSVVFSFLIRPGPQAWFWVLVCLGAWHNALASDPVSMPRECC